MESRGENDGLPAAADRTSAETTTVPPITVTSTQAVPAIVIGRRIIAVTTEAEAIAAETSAMAESSVPEFPGPEATFAYVRFCYLARCGFKSGVGKGRAWHRCRRRRR